MPGKRGSNLQMTSCNSQWLHFLGRSLNCVLIERGKESGGGGAVGGRLHMGDCSV